ncbi:hypothetical protein FOCC_FOCC016826, partial [Frankliniella occidentalis]
MRDWEAAVQQQAVGDQPPLLAEEAAPVDYAPTAAQLMACARRLSTGTALRPDGLPGELFRYAPEAFFDHLAALVRRHWEACSFPSAWHPIPKAPRPQTTEEFRTLSMCAAVYKMVALHLLDLLQTAPPPCPTIRLGSRPAAPLTTTSSWCGASWTPSGGSAPRFTSLGLQGLRGASPGPGGGRGPAEH